MDMLCLRSCGLGVGVALVAAALAACDVKVTENGLDVDVVQGRASDEWTRTYDLPKGGRLDIVSIDGGIEAFPAAGSQVEVRVRRQVQSRSDEAARELLAKVAIKEEVGPDRVRVESPDVRQFGGLLQSVRLEYRVNLPPGLVVSLRTQNGGVRLENVDGQLTAATTNGGVTGRGVTGAIDASTVNGGIVMDLASIAGDVRVVTVNGGIRLDVPADVKASLDASAVNGGVSVQQGLNLEPTERSRLRVTGPINGGGPRLLVQTTNGGVRIGMRGTGSAGARGEEPEEIHGLRERGSQ
jgi:hypothetical protein